MTFWAWLFLGIAILLYSDTRIRKQNNEKLSDLIQVLDKPMLLNRRLKLLKDIYYHADKTGNWVDFKSAEELLNSVTEYGRYNQSFSDIESINNLSQNYWFIGSLDIEKAEKAIEKLKSSDKEFSVKEFKNYYKKSK